MKRIGLTTLITLCLGLSGCGFHLRSPNDFPATLRHLTLSSDNVNNAISAELQRQLHDAHVNMNDSKNALHLTLSNSKTRTDLPIAFNANAATTYTYTLKVDVALANANHRTIDHTTLSASRSVVHNVNQVSSANITPLMRRTLTQELVNHIYNWLTSHQIQKAITTQSTKT